MKAFFSVDFFFSFCISASFFSSSLIEFIQHRTGKIKTDISDHFSIVFALNTCEKSKPEDNPQFIYKRFYGEEQIELFKHEVSQIEWKNIINNLDNPNTA